MQKGELRRQHESTQHRYVAHAYMHITARVKNWWSNCDSPVNALAAEGRTVLQPGRISRCTTFRGIFGTDQMHGWHYVTYFLNGSGAALVAFVSFATILRPLYSGHVVIVSTHTTISAGRQTNLPWLNEYIITARWGFTEQTSSLLEMHAVLIRKQAFLSNPANFTLASFM